MNCIYYFSITNPNLNFWDNTAYLFFHYCWFWFVNILRNFVSIFKRDSVFYLLPCITFHVLIYELCWAVSVCSGSYNKMPQTKLLINNKNVFLTIMEIVNPISGDNMVKWGHFHRLPVWTLTVSSHGERA